MFIEQAIIQALRLIQDGRCHEGVQSLVNLTRLFPTDFRPWWAIANSSDDSDQIRNALYWVIRLKPDQDEAHELLTLLEATERRRRRMLTQ